MPNPNMANREVCDLIFVDYKETFLKLRLCQRNYN